MSQESLWSVEQRRPRNNHGQEESRASFNNTYNCEDSNLVFITSAAAESEEDLGFQFEDTDPLALENTKEKEKTACTEGGEVIKVEVGPARIMSPVTISSDENKNPSRLPRSLQNATTDTRADLGTNQVELSVQSRRKQAISIREIVSSNGSESESYDNLENTFSSDLEEIDSYSASSAADYEFEFEDAEPMRASASSLVSSSVVQKKSQTDKKQRNFLCDFNECTARFTNSGHLNRHKLTHTGEKLFICDWPKCKQRFALKHHLANHIKAHTGEKSYICNWTQCGKRYSRNTYLNVHKKSHTGDGKPFGCAYCGQRYSNRDILITHERTHTGEKPYICELPECGKRFVTHWSLIRHHNRITHTGEKSVTFICDEAGCGKQFIKHGNLLRHKQKSQHHQS